MQFFGREQELQELCGRASLPASMQFVLGTYGVGKSSLLEQFFAEQEKNAGRAIASYRPAFLTSGFGPLAGVVTALVEAVFDSPSSRNLKPLQKAIRAVLGALEPAQLSAHALEFYRKVQKSLPENHEVHKLLLKKLGPKNFISTPDVDDQKRTREAATECFRFFRNVLEQETGNSILLLLDQFELFREDVAGHFIDFGVTLPTGLHIVINIDSSDIRAQRSIQHMARRYKLEEATLTVKGLRKQVLGKWLREALNEEPGEEQLEEIYEATGGIAVNIGEWLKSPDANLRTVNKDKLAADGYFKERFENLDPELRRFARQLSVLDYPLDQAHYVVLNQNRPKEEVTTYLQQLVELGIFSVQNGTPWFKGRYYKDLIYKDILINLIKKYHHNVVILFEQAFKEALNSGHPDDLPVVQSYAGHLHRAMDYRRSFPLNLRIAHRYLRFGNYASAYDAFKIAHEAGKLIGYDVEAVAIKGNAAFVENILGRHEKVYPEHKQVSEFFVKRMDRANYAISLYYFGLSAFHMGKYNESQSAMKAFLDSAPSSLPEDFLLRTRIFFGHISARLGQNHVAEKVAADCLIIAEEDAHRSEMGRAYSLQATVAYRSGDYPLAAALLEKASTCYRDAQDIPHGLGTLSSRVVVALLQGQVSRARELLREANALQEDHRVFTSRPILLLLDGAASLMEGKTDEAWEVLESAEKLADYLGYQKLQGLIQFHLGLLQKAEGEYKPARKALEEAIASLPAEQFPLFNAGARKNLGMLLEECGFLDDALAEYQASLEIFRKKSVPEKSAATLWRSAVVYLKEENPEKAHALFEEVSEILQSIELEESKRMTLQGALKVFTHGEEASQDTLDFFKAQLAEAGKIKDPHLRTESLYNLGIWNLRSGNLEEASRWFSDCEQAAEERKYAEFEVVTKVRLGEIAYRLGNYDEARKLLDDALAKSRGRGDRFHEAESSFFLGYLHFERCEWSEASVAFRTALRIYRQMNFNTTSARLHVWLARVDEAQGNIEEARRHLDEALAIGASEIDRAILLAIQFRQACLDYDLGRKEDARVLWEELTRSATEPPFTEFGVLSLCRLGELAMEEREFSKAYEHFIRGKDLDIAGSGRYGEIIDSYLETLKFRVGTKMYGSFREVVNS